MRCEYDVKRRTNFVPPDVMMVFENVQQLDSETLLNKPLKYLI
jgi:hypothetical protein